MKKFTSANYLYMFRRVLPGYVVKETRYVGTKHVYIISEANFSILGV